MSFGLMDGAPHDGKSLVEQAIDNFCRQKDDLAIFVSAGNNGNTFKHWGGQPIRSDSSFCFFSCAYSGRLYFVIPRQYSSKLSISFTDTKPFNLYAPNSISNDSIIQQTPFFNIGDIINSPRVVYHETKFPNGNLSSNFVLSASHYNEEYDELVVNVQEFTGNNTTYAPHLYRFIWKGEGMVHAWFPFWNLHPLFNFTNPLPNDSTFVMSDNDYTTNIPSHAFTVLSSGAYNLRTCYVHMKSRVVSQYERCRTAHFTSHGPTLDGRIKPDVISPGDNVMAPRARTDSFYGHDFVVDTNTVSFGGTSAASPITAGIAALIWEKYPQYSRQQVFDVIKSSARWDEFAERWGARPNNVAGAGKTDAFAALTGQATDLTAYCAAVDICSPPAPPVVNPPIDPNGPPLPTANIFVVWPNPVQQWFNLRYICNENTQLSLFDASGRALYSRMLPRTVSPAQVLLPVEKFASGIYYMRITGNNILFTKALVVAK
jgi:subtilisin family serine protease